MHATTSSTVSLFDMVAISQVATILLATVAFAAPPSRIESRVARRHRSSPIRRIERDNLAINSTFHEAYTSNWAGAQLLGPSVCRMCCCDFANSCLLASLFRELTALLVVPSWCLLSVPQMAVQRRGSALMATAVRVVFGRLESTWVITTAPPLTTVSHFVYFSTCKKYLPPALAWYEWFPDVSYYFSDIIINAGDTIRLTVTADSSTSGEAVLENLSNGQTVSQYITSTYALCGQGAEWIVEDYLQDVGNGTYSLVPLCDFGTVTFSNASAQTSSGSTLSPQSANIMDIQQDGPVLTSTKQDSNVLSISYIG